jgi:hypothetical protein
MYLDWIPSAENPIADAVSREEWNRFYAVAAANHYPTSALRCVQVLPRLVDSLTNDFNEKIGEGHAPTS